VIFYAFSIFEQKGLIVGLISPTKFIKNSILEMLGNLRSQVQKIIQAKKIWPFSSAADGKDSGYDERSAFCFASKKNSRFGNRKKYPENR
jgi:hypothetical protein